MILPALRSLSTALRLPAAGHGARCPRGAIGVGSDECCGLASRGAASRQELQVLVFLSPAAVLNWSGTRSRRPGRRFVVPETGRAHCFRQVIADGHHGLPDRLHGLDKQVVDPVRIGFGIEHGAREIDRDNAVACL